MPVVRCPASFDVHSENTTKTSGTTLSVGLVTTTEYRAAAKFDISGIPSSSDITRVELEVNVRTAGATTGRWDIRPYNTTGQSDPNADTAAQVFTRAATGTPFINDTSLFRCVGSFRVTLGLGVDASACTVLETAKAAADIFSLGFTEQGGDDVYCALEGMAHADDNPMALIVTYNETITVIDIVRALARRMDPARYETGTITTSSATAPIDTSMLQDDDFWKDYWMLLVAGTYIGQARRIKNFTASSSTFTLEKAFGGVSGLVAYDIIPFEPALGCMAVNSALAELFPLFVHLPVTTYVGIRQQQDRIIDMPTGIDFVDAVEWRPNGQDRTWRSVAFVVPDETKIQIIDKLPLTGIALRVVGRQRLTSIDDTDALTTTDNTEFAYPDVGSKPIGELILVVAERKLHEWLLPDYDTMPAVGQSAEALGPGRAATDRRLADLRYREATLKAQILPPERSMLAATAGPTNGRRTRGTTNVPPGVAPPEQPIESVA